MAAPSGYGGYYPPPPSHRPSRGRTILIIFAVFVVIILVVSVLFYLLLPVTVSSTGTTPAITVTVVNFVSPDNTCGLDGATSAGYTANASETDTFEYGIDGNNTTGGGTSACIVHSVTTSTSGFGLWGANVPLVIGINETRYLWFNVTTPNSSYNGPLTFVLT